MNPKFSVSIVSHGHRLCLEKLLADIIRLDRTDLELIITLNIEEDVSFLVSDLRISTKVIRNRVPRGFAANHNTAFEASCGQYFVIVNPDIRLTDDPFAAFEPYLDNRPAAIYAPVVVNSSGAVEDSVRSFPTPILLVRRVLSRTLKFPMPEERVKRQGDLMLPDWVAGMFVIVPRELYARLGGLDERFHMYFEDVDFCLRAHLEGEGIFVIDTVRVIHDAQRDSHRKPAYMIWHLRSTVRFFTSSAYWRLQFRRSVGKRIAK